MNEQGDFISVNYRVIYSGNYNGRNGVGLILNAKWVQCGKRYLAFDDRLIMIRLNSVSINIAIIQVYMPISQASNVEIKEIYEKI